ncbi:hypothetical protein O181_045407 [Austropuccinia psidii MF-1]|uniref:Peptidase S8/S53 domain-containing protein n=1 Tax=Austropuccinia psidii MF-1 TaxID=1389203 RepID=A0A9Q3HIQ1_9BASI|nr:hypothetical protein [Austropuccinia psidii MF-1]
MFKSEYPISLWILSVLAIFSILFPTLNCDPSDDTSYPNEFILELSPEAAPTLADFEAQLTQLKIPYTIVWDYTTVAPDVFYGVSIRLDHAEDTQRVQNLSQVQSFSVIKHIQPIRPLAQGAVQKLPKKEQHPDFPPHVQANITDLHRLGIFGEGIKVAIVDSGVDCAHPALGGGFGKGYKIEFGLNLIDNKGGDPCSPCAKHGTHVTGIVGADDVGHGVFGVAPKATLGMYRVLDCDELSTTSDSVILAAVLHAYKEGADIISISIGSPAGWTRGSMLLDVIDKLVAKHSAIILIAAGNEGAEGLFFTNRPAAAQNAISVGSVDSDKEVSISLQTSTGRDIRYWTAVAFPQGNYQLYFTSNSTNSSSDACEPLPASTPDLSKFVVVIRRGTCYFALKAKHAAEKGANLVLFYMNSTEIIKLSTKESNISVATISNEDGVYLFQEAQKNEKFEISSRNSEYTYVPSPRGGYMSGFSAYGPTFDFLSPQPAISGVGRDIISTYPLQEGSYAAFSGTSMSTPQLSGIAALILSVKGRNFDGLSMRTRLATTARLLHTNLGKGPLESVVHQGGGLVNAFCAAFSNTSLSTSALALNDTVNFNGSQGFTVWNNGNMAVNYTLTHRPAVTLSTFSPQSKYHRPDDEPRELKSYAQVVIKPESFVLKPGGKQLVTTTFTEPTGLQPEDMNVYSGYISLETNAPCESHNLPYFGVHGSIKSPSIIDRGPEIDGRFNLPHFVFEDNNRTSELEKDGPLIWDFKKNNSTSLIFSVNWGTPFMMLDLMPANATFSNISDKPNDNWKTYYKGVKLLGMIPQWSQDYLGRLKLRSAPKIRWNGTLVVNEDQKPVRLENGTYRVLFRALRPTGDRKNDDDYEIWVKVAEDAAMKQFHPNHYIIV